MAVDEGATDGDDVAAPCQVTVDGRTNASTERKDVARRVIVRLRPDVGIRGRVNQLDGHADAVALLDQRTLDDQVGSKLGGGRRQGPRRLLVEHR